MKLKKEEGKKPGVQIRNRKLKYSLEKLGLIIIFSLAILSSCKDDDDEMVTGIVPKGPQPEWAPTIKPEMLRVIEVLDSLSGGVALTSLSPEQARMAPTPTDAVKAVMEEYNIPTPPSKVDTTGSSVQVEGGNIHVRIYTPKGGTGPYPGIVYYHGGGWVIATIDTYDASARALAAQAQAVVISVEYRKGPEFKFPTAHNDSYAAYEWVHNNASSLNIDASKIAVAGESAGGNLAAAVAMMARDNGVNIPVHQLLVYPIAGYDFNTPSYQTYANAKPLSKPLMQWFFNHYLNEPEEGTNPWISLVSAPNLDGLPPATIINAEIDPLQSEGQAYAAKLEGAGIPVSTQVYEGVTHEFFGMATVVPEAKEAQAFAADELKKAFNE